MKNVPRRRPFRTAVSVLLFVPLTMGMALSGGCRNEVDPANPEANRNLPGEPQMPTIDGLRYDDLLAKLGDSFQPQKADSNDAKNMNRFLKSGEPFQELVIIEHDQDGSVFSVAAYLGGPAGQTEQMDQTYAAAVGHLLTAVGIELDDDLKAQIAIGSLRTGIGCGHVFRQKMVHVYMTPSAPVENDSTTFAYQPNWVEREFRLSPARGVQPPPSKALPGTTLKQLLALIEGFSETYRVGDEQVVYTRQTPTHLEVLHCYLRDGDKLTRIEAFVGHVKNGLDRQKLTDPLWEKIARLPYSDANPDKVLEFLRGEKMKYTVDVGVTVGSGCFWLPVDSGGKRPYLNVWAVEPESPL